MKYSKTAIGLLTAQYRSVLKKCLMINLGLFALGTVAATPANGETYTGSDSIAIDDTNTISAKLAASDSYLTTTGGLAVDKSALQTALTGAIAADPTGAGFVTGNAISTKLQDYATTDALSAKADANVLGTGFDATNTVKQAIDSKASLSDVTDYVTNKLANGNNPYQTEQDVAATLQNYAKLGADANFAKVSAESYKYANHWYSDSKLDKVSVRNEIGQQVSALTSNGYYLYSDGNLYFDATKDGLRIFGPNDQQNATFRVNNASGDIYSNGTLRLMGDNGYRALTAQKIAQYDNANAFLGLDTTKTVAEALSVFEGDTNIWVGNGEQSNPTSFVDAFKNINSALGTIHGLVDGGTGKVKNNTSVFANGPITSNLTGEEISTALRAGTSVEDLQVDLDNAVAKIRSGETMVGKAFADKDGNEIDTTYAKLTEDVTFKNITATESVATPKLVLNTKELTDVKTDAITTDGEANILATSSAVAATVKTMSENATYTPGTGAVNTTAATTINEAILANDKVSSANKALLGELTATDNWANIKSLANGDNTSPATVVKAIQNVGNFIDNMDNKIGDLSSLHPITNNADDTKAESLVVAINNFDDNLHNKTNTYTAAQAFTGGIKFSNADDAQVVSNVDNGQGAVAVGEGKADTLATTATVLKSAQNAEFSAAPGETLPDSINGAATIHAAIVNVATATDENTKAIGDLDFSGAKNVEATDLTEAVLDLDAAIGDLSTITADYAQTNTGSGYSNPADLATAIQNVATAAAKADGDLQFDNAYTKGEDGNQAANLTDAINNMAKAAAEADGDLQFDNAYTQGEDGNQAANLTDAINNVAKNAQDAVEGAIEEAKQYTDDRIDGTGEDSTVTVGSNAGQVIIGKTQDNDGELEILSGIAINNDGNNREIEIAAQHDNHVVGADFTAEDETISLMASNKNNANATGMTIDNMNQTITLGSANAVTGDAYELEIDSKNGTTIVGTGKEGENVTIGKGTIVADASIAAGTLDENGALEKGVQMTADGDLTATNSALIGSKDDAGDVTGVELTAEGNITASGDATIAGDLSAANGDFTVATTTDDTDSAAPVTTTTMTLNGDANISGKATFGDAADETKSVTIEQGKVTANEVDTKSLTADNGTFNETLTVGTADENGALEKGVQMTADGDLTATNSALIGSKDDAGNVTGVELTAEGNITASGDATIAGNLSAAGGNFTVITTTDVTDPDAPVTTTTMTLDGDADITGDTSIGGTLDVTGKTTLSAENGMAFGDGQTVTSIDDGSVAQTMPEDTTTEDPNKSALATVATVLKSAENAKFTGVTDENHATGTAETIKEAFQNIDTFVGSKETLTNKSISDKADLTTALNSFANNVEAGMGGEFAEGGNWSAEISNEANAPENGYYSAFTAENLADAISTVYSTIGTADKLQGYNGVSAENTVNDNIAAVNGTIGNIENLNADLKNLTNGTDVAPETVVEAFNNIDATLGRIHGLFDGEKVNTTGRIESSTGSHSNLAQGTTVETHLVSLDNAIGDRHSITNKNGSNGYVLVERDSVADVLSDIASQIGTAEDLAGATINGVSADNTVNQNIAAINSSLGDISELKDAAFAQGATLVDAVKNVDDKLVNLDNRVAKTEKDLKELHHDFRRGMASMAAMSSLVPNSRSTGKTSLSLGTGAYGGHGAVAVGGFHYITDNLMLNAGVSWSDSSDTAYRMGVTYSF